MNDTNTTPTKTTGFTHRTDDWQKYPTLIMMFLGAFAVYGTFRAFQNNYFEAGNLLSPFYSPNLGWICKQLDGITPFSIHWSPAVLILPIPGLFRATCYYYRKAYYRAFFGTPKACGVTGTANPGYTGEARGIWTVQNIHRYAFYMASVVLAILWWDAFQTLFAANHFFNFAYFQVSAGTILFFLNVVLLSGYSFGCHACRHLAGGCLDNFSSSGAAKTSLSIWERITTLNEKHEQWAWASLISVVSADMYTAAVAAHIFPDPVLFSMDMITNMAAK